MRAARGAACVCAPLRILALQVRVEVLQQIVDLLIP